MLTLSKTDETPLKVALNEGDYKMKTILVSYIKQSGEMNTIFQQILKSDDVNGMTEFLNYLSYSDKRILLDDNVDFQQNFPLLYALKFLSHDMATLIFDHHKNINHKDQGFSWKANSSRENALMLASMKGCKEIVKDLLSIYDKFNQMNHITKSDNEGMNSLMLSAVHGHFEIVEILLPHYEKDGSTTNRNKAGKSVLDLTKSSHIEELLVKVF